MISSFRKFFQSKIGLAITFLFIGLIALAFAATDITGSTFGGVSGGDRVALVGDERIDTSELNSRAQTGLQQVQQRNPTVTMDQFIEEGLYEDVLESLIDRYALTEYAKKYGLRAGTNLVNSEIQRFPAFRGPGGEVTRESLTRALQQARITEAEMRADFALGLLTQQLVDPAVGSPQMPANVAKHYAALVNERRKGEIALIPSTAFAPDGEPSQAQLTKFYNDNKARYVRPERRTIRYAAFGAEQIKTSLTATPAEIKARYDAEPERFASSETRSVTSVLVSSEQEANAIAERVRGGVSLEQAADDAGFNISKVENETKEEMTSSYSFAVAEAVFAAGRGEVAGPARASLGFYVARVDDVTTIGARTLAQATPELKRQIETEKEAAALADLSTNIENDVRGGTSLVDVAGKYDLDVVTSAPIMADGRVFGDPNTTLPDQLMPTLETVFQMDEGEPDLAQIVPGVRFVVFDVLDIEEASAPPLAEIRGEVVNSWKLFEGSKRARASADRILKAARGQSTLSAAIQKEDADIPPLDQIDMPRQQLLTQRGRNIPPPLVLLFSMAEGTYKLLEAPNDLGWYVVALNDIVATPLEDPEELERTRVGLAPALSNEYQQQLIKAIRAEIGVERNEAAIEAVRKNLLGEN